LQVPKLVLRTKQDEDIPATVISQDKVSQVITQIVELFGSKELPSYCAKMIIDAPEKPSSNWSLGNQLLMLFHGTQDARGFQQWKEVNRFVKKGAKAFYILGPVIVNKKSENPEEKTALSKILVGFRAIAVFSLEDTEGQELPVYHPRTFPPLLSVAKKWGLSVEYEKLNGAYGYFSPTEQKIVLSTEEVGTFFHELGHAAHSKIGKLEAGQNAEQETTAQLTAAILCRIYGYDEDAYSWNYIASYAGARSPKAVGRLCLRVLGNVQKIINMILE
jgi:hypothetical protein